MSCSEGPCRGRVSHDPTVSGIVLVAIAVTEPSGDSGHQLRVQLARVDELCCVVLDSSALQSTSSI